MLYLAKNVIFFFLLHIYCIWDRSVVLFMPYVTGCCKEVTVKCSVDTDVCPFSMMKLCLRRWPQRMVASTLIVVLLNSKKFLTSQMLRNWRNWRRKSDWRWVSRFHILRDRTKNILMQDKCCYFSSEIIYYVAINVIVYFVGLFVKWGGKNFVSWLFLCSHRAFWLVHVLLVYQQMHIEVV